VACVAGSSDNLLNLAVWMRPGAISADREPYIIARPSFSDPNSGKAGLFPRSEFLKEAEVL
jgi:hypothetical protein